MGQPATNESQQGLNRRQALARGAMVGGALVWAAPLVQVVSLTAAHAESPSAPGGGQPGGNQPPGGGSQPPGAQPPRNAAPPPAGVPPQQSPQPPAPTPQRRGQLAFTGPGLPVVQTTAVAAALIATGVAAQAVGSRRPAVAADGADDVADTFDPDPEQ